MGFGNSKKIPEKNTHVVRKSKFKKLKVISAKKRMFQERDIEKAIRKENKEKKKLNTEIKTVVGDELFNEDAIQMNEDIEISNEDEILLSKFNTDLALKLSQTINTNIENKRKEELRTNTLNDPKVKTVYGDVAKLLKEYRNGQLPRAMQVLPNLKQWKEILYLTKPKEWSKQAYFAVTKILASGLDNHRATIFYKEILLPAVQNDVRKNKKLNPHLYNCLIKSIYKPAAFIKGILLPFCEDINTTIKESQIMAGLLAKIKVPIIHASIGIIKILALPISAATCIVLKSFLEKKYALPMKVIHTFYQYFISFENEMNTLPVIWNQNLLSYCQIYRKNFDEMQISAMVKLAKKKGHYIIGPEVIKTLTFKTLEDLKAKDLKIELE